MSQARIVGSNRLEFFLTCSRDQLKRLLCACNQLWLSVFLHLIFFIFSSDTEDIIHSFSGHCVYFHWRICFCCVSFIIMLAPRLGQLWGFVVDDIDLDFFFPLNFSGHYAPFLFLTCVSMCFSPLILKVPEDLDHGYIPSSQPFSLGLSLQVTLGRAKR